MKKPDLHSRYNNPVKKVFNKKNKKSKGGQSTLAITRGVINMNEVKDAIQNKGLSIEEIRVAMAEVSMGYKWGECSVLPKSNVAKKRDYEAIYKDFNQGYRDWC